MEIKDGVRFIVVIEYFITLISLVFKNSNIFQNIYEMYYSIFWDNVTILAPIIVVRVSLDFKFE